MTVELMTIDRQPLKESLEQWRADQEDLAAGYRESLEALEAYQKHLDHWQNQLAAERDELNSQHGRLTADQEKLNHDRAQFDSERQAAGSESEQLALLHAQLAEARDQVGALETEKEQLTDQQAQWNAELQQLRERLDHQSLPASSEPKRERPNDPVVGSIVAQFNKLRQQQALGRRPPVK